MARRKRKTEPERPIVIVGQEKPKPTPKKVNVFKPLPSFDTWWAQLRSRKMLREDLKDIIKKHFEAKGFLENKKFDEGLKDFGIET